MSSIAFNKTIPLHFQPFLSSDIADLARIYDPDINICIVQRKLNESVERFIEHLLERTPSISFIESIEFATFNFKGLLPEFVSHPGHRELCNDVALLVGLFSDLFDFKTRWLTPSHA